MWALLKAVLFMVAVVAIYSILFHVAQIRRRTPRQIPPSTRGHVIICAYEALQVDQARMVFANADDLVNTNITLTVREVSETVPIIAIAHDESAVEVLQLSGATQVLPLNRWLGEQLANRVNATHTQLHEIGRYKDLLIAELPVHHTPLVGKTIRQTRMRQNTGVSIVGVWERGRLLPAQPDQVLTEPSVPVLVGTEKQLEELNFIFGIYDVNENPVLVVGGGTVGMAAARALQRKEIAVHLIDRDKTHYDRLCTVCRQVFTGEATNPDVLAQAGVDDAPSVILTTSDDALNIYSQRPRGDHPRRGHRPVLDPPAPNPDRQDARPEQHRGEDGPQRRRRPAKRDLHHQPARLDAAETGHRTAYVRRRSPTPPLRHPLWCGLMFFESVRRGGF